jgi:NAD(P)-dependent dehydrogenase (short-subunit alcohol dehydrogenase family)
MARNIVVTGSASGIGKATAARLAKNGDRVIGVDLRDAEVIADLSTPEGCTAMAHKIESITSGKLDAVVANAGVSGMNAYAINYWGAIGTLEALRPMLLRSSAPRAAVTASVVATFPHNPKIIAALEAGERNPPSNPGEPYVNSKHAIARWVRRAGGSQEWSGSGILLNAIGPGVVDTNLVAAFKDQPDVVSVIENSPLKRIAQAEEMAEVFAFLVSPQNTFLSGQIIYVDGGLDAHNRPDLV